MTAVRPWKTRRGKILVENMVSICANNSPVNEGEARDVVIRDRMNVSVGMRADRGGGEEKEDTEEEETADAAEADDREEERMQDPEEDRDDDEHAVCGGGTSGESGHERAADD